MNKGIPTKSNNIIALNTKLNKQGNPSKQINLNIEVWNEGMIDGIEMGVLQNGIPYLTQSGLARIAGITQKTVSILSKEWEEKYFDDCSNNRIGYLKENLFDQGFRERSLYIAVNVKGTIHYAYPDIVCMAILEYYVFGITKLNNIARQNYRNITRYGRGLGKFIYDALNYNPGNKWKYYHDRVNLLTNTVPLGYFSIFHETSPLIPPLINAGLTVDDKTIPDIGIGKIWSARWKTNNLDNKYDKRIDYIHNYPKYYPQAKSNPQHPFAYPDSALGEFRRWLRQDYLITKFPKYILEKAKILPGGKEEAKQIANLFTN